MTRRLWLIADDFGLSPGIDEAIVHLLRFGRLSGTGCMTGFPEWPIAARRLRDLPSGTAIGLHLTLTDQIAATGLSSLAPEGRLPSFGRLAAMTATSAKAHEAALVELDAQFERFVEATGRVPDFVDGHQHVHFLPVARQWLATLAKQVDHARLPFVRGAPATRHAPREVFVKATIARQLATGFDAFARAAGFVPWRPLAGFYRWERPGGFVDALRAGLASLPTGAVFMCHPGRVDRVLEERDRLLGPREVEFDYLASEAFEEDLARSGASLMRLDR